MGWSGPQRPRKWGATADLQNQAGYLLVTLPGRVQAAHLPAPRIELPVHACHIPLPASLLPHHKLQGGLHAGRAAWATCEPRTHDCCSTWRAADRGARVSEPGIVLRDNHHPDPLGQQCSCRHHLRAHTRSALAHSQTPMDRCCPMMHPRSVDRLACSSLQQTVTGSKSEMAAATPAYSRCACIAFSLQLSGR